MGGCRAPGEAVVPCRLRHHDKPDGGLFFGAFMAMGLYLPPSRRRLHHGVYRRWIGWVSAVSAGLVLSGDLLVLVSESAFIAVLMGYVLYKAVLIALGLDVAPGAGATATRHRERVSRRPLS